MSDVVVAAQGLTKLRHACSHGQRRPVFRYSAGHDLLKFFHAFEGHRLRQILCSSQQCRATAQQALDIIKLITHPS